MMTMFRAIATSLLIALSACGSGAQFTVPQHTGSASGSVSYPVSFSTWNYSGSVASSDSNYDPTQSTVWNNTSYISGDVSSNYAQLWPVCKTANSTCLTPTLYGSISSPGLPSNATITSFVFSFLEGGPDAATTGSTVQTQNVYICVGSSNTSFESCAGQDSEVIEGDRTPWITSSTPFTRESYTSPMLQGFWTTAMVNAGINLEIQLQNSEGDGSYFNEPFTVTNDWILTINYTY